MDTDAPTSILSFDIGVQPAVLPSEDTPGDDTPTAGRLDDGMTMAGPAGAGVDDVEDDGDGTEGGDRHLFQAHIRCTLVIDGRAYTHDLLDSSVLFAGPELPRASYYLFTCGCGVPGCNGYFEEMVQTRAQGRVVWEVPAEDALARDLGATRFVFDADAFDAARAAALATLRAYEAQGLHMASRLDSQGRPYATLEESAARFHAWNRNIAHLQRLVEHALDPALPTTLPAFFDTFPPRPERVHPTFVGDLAVAMLNTGPAPDPTECAEHLAALPALVGIFQRFADDGDAALATAELAPYWRFMDADGVHDPLEPALACVLLPGDQGAPQPAVHRRF